MRYNSEADRGAGNVLHGIIYSEQFPVIRLTKIFRQAQSSRIIMNTHRINAGACRNKKSYTVCSETYHCYEIQYKIEGAIERNLNYGS